MRSGCLEPLQRVANSQDGVASGHARLAYVRLPKNRGEGRQVEFRVF